VKSVKQNLLSKFPSFVGHNKKTVLTGCDEVVQYDEEKNMKILF